MPGPEDLKELLAEVCGVVLLLALGVLFAVAVLGVCLGMMLQRAVQ